MKLLVPMFIVPNFGNTLDIITSTNKISFGSRAKANNMD